MPVLYPLTNNDVVQVTIAADYQGSVILNTMHYDANVTGTITDGAAALNDALSKILGGDPGIVSVMLALLVADYTVTSVTAQIVHPTRKPYERIVTELQGDASNPGIPSNTALSLTRRSSAVGRGRSGHLQLTGLPLTSLLGAKFTGATLASLSGLIDALEETIDLTPVTATLVPIVWSPVKPTARDEQLDVIANDTVRTMHRRTLRLGV